MGQQKRFDPVPPEATGRAPLLWETIFRNIVDDIQRGVYQPGALLPSHAQICAHWKVSKSTSSRVLTELENTGWARSAGTRGYIAAIPDPAPQGNAAIMDATRPDLGSGEHPIAPTGPTPTDSQGHPIPRPHYVIPLTADTDPALTTIQRLTVGPEPAPPDVAHALGLPAPGVAVTVRRHVLCDAAGHVPVEMRAAYLTGPAAATPLGQPVSLPAGPWHEVLTEIMGHPVTPADIMIGVRPADPAEAAVLALAPHTPVLVRTITHRDTHTHAPVDYTVTIWPAYHTRLHTPQIPPPT